MVTNKLQNPAAVIKNYKKTWNEVVWEKILGLKLQALLKFFVIYNLKLDDAAIQVYKDGDFGAYLDLESSLAEQSEDIEGINAR